MKKVIFAISIVWLCIINLAFAIEPSKSVIQNEIPLSAREALEGSDQLVLLSLNPEGGVFTKNFHGYQIQGKTVVKDPNVKKEIVDAFEQAVKESNGIGARCFNPRHGIRVVDESRIIDFLICFECLQVEVYVDDKKSGHFFITALPQTLFDKILHEAKIL